MPAGYFQGWADELNSKGGFTLALANLGMTIQSAYLNLTAQPQVAQSLISEFKTAASRIEFLNV